MKTILANMKKDFEFVLEEIDIETDKNLYKKYTEKIPVLLIDNKLFAKFRVNEQKLRRKFLDNI
ncbi:MAG: glutaredoxin family protein [Bacteroidota bacterium]|nr:glutaredoxin family protein [Bacteroidota bacterium]